MKHLKLFSIFNENLDSNTIDSICKEYGIENYIINTDGSIDVDGYVDLSGKKLIKLPLKFRNVSVGFYCDNNQLTSLEGCPGSVGGDFWCYNNPLTSLEGCPTSVGGGFYCFSDFDRGKLTSLKGSPTNDIVREDGIVLDRLNIFLEDIGKPVVKNVEGHKNIY